MSFGAQSACDAGQAHGAADKPKGARPTLVLVTTILASSLSFIDGSVVNVGLPAIGRDLHGGAADLQWVVNGYLLPLSALLLIGGALGDRYGRKLILVIGVAVFALSSAGCALAPSLPWLLSARWAQGAGAALLMPNSLAILGGAYSGEARGRAIGTWAAIGSMTSALGPVLGGGLIDSVGWRAIFLLNLPIAAAAIVLALRYVKDEPDKEKTTPLDIGGAALATLALGALAWGLTIGSGPQGWTISAIAAVALGVVFLLGFVAWEKRLGDAAMMPLALFGSRSFVGLSLLTLLLYGALGGLIVLLPYTLIQASGYSATWAGASLAPFALILTVLSPIMGGVAGKMGSRLPDPVLSTLDQSDFDALWLFAVDTGEGLTAEDCGAISRFRKRGGGLMVTRDHMDLGSSVCTLGGVGAAHFFHTKNLDPDEAHRRIDDPRTTAILWPNYHSGANGDFQEIAAVEPLHPVLTDPAAPEGRLRFLPSHPHEGAVGKPKDDPTARVIATGTSKATGAAFNIAVAFERSDAGGRAIAQSTFHHFADYNWDPAKGAPSFVTEPPGHALAASPEAQHSMHQYVKNIAFWLVERPIDSDRAEARLDTRLDESLAESFPASDPPAV